MMPKVSVLMPAYNCEKTVRGAIQSVLDQSFRDFELIIIQDGSTDSTSKILQTFSDDRIQVIDHVQNQGLISSLNEGILKSKGQWIARIDSDDEMAKSRLQLQIEFLEKTPHVDILGSNVISMDQDGKKIKKLLKKSGEITLSDAWIPTPLFHPSTLIKTDLLRNNLFSNEALHCEDYELWLRLLKKGARVFNMSEALTFYRIHPSSVTQRFRDLQLKNSYSVFQKYFNHASINENQFYALIGVRGSKLSFLRRLHLIQKITGDQKSAWRECFRQLIYAFR